MDRADLDAPGRHQLGQARALRPREAEVQPARHAVFEQVQVFGSASTDWHHVQAVHPRRVDLHQRSGQKVGLLLVVAFQADLVARLQHGLSSVPIASVATSLSWRCVPSACAARANRPARFSVLVFQFMRSIRPFLNPSPP